MQRVVIEMSSWTHFFDKYVSLFISYFGMLDSSRLLYVKIICNISIRKTLFSIIINNLGCGRQALVWFGLTFVTGSSTDIKESIMLQWDEGEEGKAVFHVVRSSFCFVSSSFLILCYFPSLQDLSMCSTCVFYIFG